MTGACLKCGGPKPKGQGRKLCDACKGQVKPKRQGSCFRCGEPSAPQKVLCDECRDLARWKRRTKRRATRRKPCSRCGGPKGPGQCRRLCDRCLAEGQKVQPCINCGVRPKRYRTAKLCEICRAQADEARRKYNRERQRAYALNKKKPVKARERKNINQRQRMGLRLRAERAGTPIPPLDQATYERLYGTGRGSTQQRLPVAPLRPLLTGVDAQQFADDVGLSESFVHRVQIGEYEGISVPDADRICVGLGLPLELVYGATA